VRVSTLFRQVSQALFFPQSCVLCDEWVLNSDFSPLCQTCLLSLEEHHQRICYYCGVQLPGSVLEALGTCTACRAGALPFDFIRSYGPYAGNLRTLIWKFKFEGYRRLADPLAAFLESSLSNRGLRAHPTWIVPVPAHPCRKRTRGFDQTFLLGHALSPRIGVPVFSGLRRVKATRPQPDLTVQERLKNVRKAFRLCEGEQLTDRDVLIADDVWTTGITVAEVCRLLRHETPVGKIIVVTPARVSRRHP
jgi:ComF family protein